jgi:hypothetical protein
MVAEAVPVAEHAQALGVDAIEQGLRMVRDLHILIMLLHAPPTVSPCAFLRILSVGGDVGLRCGMLRAGLAHEVVDKARPALGQHQEPGQFVHLGMEARRLG